VDEWAEAALEERGDPGEPPERDPDLTKSRVILDQGLQHILDLFDWRRKRVQEILPGLDHPDRHFLVLGHQWRACGALYRQISVVQMPKKAARKIESARGAGAAGKTFLYARQADHLTPR
jgi:hypothetical protein